MAALSPAEVTTRLSHLNGWQVVDGQLVKSFQFHDFPTALHFVAQVGDLAEEAGHHPDIDIRYNRVRLALVTHDEDGLTAKDFAVAAGADRLA